MTKSQNQMALPRKYIGKTALNIAKQISRASSDAPDASLLAGYISEDLTLNIRQKFGIADWTETNATEFEAITNYLHCYTFAYAGIKYTYKTPCYTAKPN